MIIFWIFVAVTLTSMDYGLWTMDCYAQDSSDYVNKAWARLGKREFSKVHILVDECIRKYSSPAQDQAKTLDSFPTKGEEDNFRIMNNVATCYFIKGEA